MLFPCEKRKFFIDKKQHIVYNDILYFKKDT